MSTVFQRSFAGGEISPSVQSRADMAKYATGLKTCRNFIVMRHGGVTRRPGTVFEQEKQFVSGNNNVRLEPFTFISVGGDLTECLLEFGHNYMRVIVNDQYVADTSGVPIESITAANPPVVQILAGTGASTGDLYRIDDGGPMSELDGRTFQVTALTSTTMSLQDMLGNDIDASTWTALTSSDPDGSGSLIYTLATILTSSMVSEMQVYQDGNSVYVSHPDIAPYALTAIATNNWTAGSLAIGSYIESGLAKKPSGVTVTGPQGTVSPRGYKVTAISSTTLEESGPSTEKLTGSKVLDKRFGHRISYSYGGAGPIPSAHEVNGLVYISSTVDESTNAKDFIVKGYDTSGNELTNTVTGGLSPMITADVFWVVNSVQVSGNATDGEIDVGKLGDLEFIVKNLPAATADGTYFQNTARWQTPASNTLESSAVTATAGRQVTVTAVDQSASFAKFTIYGTDQNGGLISEEIPGPEKDDTATTSQYYVAVTRIETDSSLGALTSGYINIGQGESNYNKITLSWTGIASALEYNVYKSINGVYGLIGVTTSTTFDDYGITPDYSSPPPVEGDPFATDYPSVVSVFQQRLFFANTNADPVRVDASALGFLNSFNYRRPLQDDDAITFSVVQRQYGPVRHLIDIGRLVILTETGEFLVRGDGAGVVTPLDINLSQQGYYGASKVPPVNIGGNAIYVQRGGRIIRDLVFDFGTDGYRGGDLTVFASHLFRYKEVSDLAYQKAPHSVLWVAQTDGSLLGMTYLPEHQIWGWHRHDTALSGKVKSLAVVKGESEDFLHMAVERTMNDGSVRTFIERLATPDRENLKYLELSDACLSYDGFNGAGKTMTVTGGTSWDATELLTMTASASYFTSADVGKELHFYDSSGTELLRMSIDTYLAGNIVKGYADRTVPSELRTTPIASTQWALAVNTVSGLWHIEGETVSVYGDGAVEASPNNPQYATPVVVSSGQVTLSDHYAVINVGLPITCDMQTLDLDTAQGETFIDKKSLSTKVTLRLEDSLAFHMGPEAPSTLTGLDDMVEITLREDTDNYGSPVPKTGVFEENIQGRWTKSGSVFIRHVDPSPVTVLGVAPSMLASNQQGGGDR